MSVTVIRQPWDIVPAFNDVEFLASSTETAQPNFVYYITIVVAGNTFVYRIPANPDGECYYNAYPLTKKFIKNFYPFGNDDFGFVTDAFQEFEINIGEEYGTTPVIYPGSDITFRTWNACLTKKERSVYDPVDYISYVASGLKWLNNLDYNGNITIKPFQDLVFYFYLFDTVIDHVTIKTYNSSNVLMNEIEIENTIISYPSYVYFNASPNSITQLLGHISGSRFTASTLPAFIGTEAYYTVSFDDLVFITVNIHEPCNSKFTDYSLYYLNRYGAFDYQPMQGNHKDTINIERTYYKGLNQTFEASDPDGNGPNPLSINKKALNTSYERTLILQSQPLNQTQLNNAQDLMTSPFVFLNIDEFDYVRYSEEDTSYELKQELTDKIVSIQATLLGTKEGRQSE